MKKKHRVICPLLVAATLSAAAPSWADPPAPTPPPIVTPLKQGQVAPWPGVLLSPSAVAQVVSQADASRAAIALAVKHQAEVDAAQQKYALDSAKSTCDAGTKVLQAENAAYAQQNKVLADQLKHATSGPSAGVWIGLGVVGGIVVTIATAFAVSKTAH